MVVEAGTTDSQRAAETCDSHNPICMSIEDNKKLMKINRDGNGGNGESVGSNWKRKAEFLMTILQSGRVFRTCEF